MTRRFTALLLSGAMMLSLCQVSLATEEAEEAVPVEEATLVEEIIPEEDAAPTKETTAAVSETAGASASQQPAMAAESSGAVYTGTLGDNVAWQLDTDSGALAITGSGSMEDYTSGSTSPLWNYRSYIQSVKIADDITSVGAFVFCSCVKLTSVNLGSGITSIGGSAFYGCIALTEVTIPDSVMSIGSGAFDGCWGLESAEFLGNAPAYFGSNVFYNSTGTSFTIFYHNGMVGWTSPTWNGYTATCIDAEITDFSTLNDNNRNAQHILFQLNDTAMTATVGANTTTTKNSAGYNGSYNGKVVVPDTVTKGKNTYKVIGVDAYAFANCPWVYTVSVGKNVSAIEPSAFRGCQNLTAITVDEGNLQFADQDGVLFDKEGLYLYAYPAGRPADTYEIPSTCTTVGTQAFYGASNLLDLTVPTSVNDIGKAAFGNCNALQSIELPFFGGSAQSTATVGYVFIGDNWSDNVCPASLKHITVHGTNLSGSAFCNCSGLEEIYLPDCGALTEIPYQCFSNCRSLQTLVFGTASPEDGMVMIPNTVTTIRSNAFAGCSSLRGITLGRGVTNLDWAAFSNCSSIEKFAVADGNTSFMADQWGVLYSADQTTLHYYPSARAWPYYNVSDKTTTICERAFTSCKKLVNLFIPKTATSLSSCISGCPSTTICCYNGSAAARYAISSGITSWYMDNYVMQGIQVLQLPEQLVFNTRSALSSSPYLTATYGDKTLQLDDYQVVLEKPYGLQTVTFTAGGCSIAAKASVVRQGDINGDSTTTASVVDVQDMQCLYEYLSTGENKGQITDHAYFEQVCDFNGDGSIDILDYQALYQITRS